MDIASGIVLRRNLDRLRLGNERGDRKPVSGCSACNRPWSLLNQARTCSSPTPGTTRISYTSRTRPSRRGGGARGWTARAFRPPPSGWPRYGVASNRPLTRGNDSTVRLFAVDRIPGTVTIPHPETIVHADLSADGSLVVTTARDEIVRTFDARTRALLAEYARRGETPVSATFASADVVVVAYEGGRVAFVNARTGAQLRSFESPCHRAALRSEDDPGPALAGCAPLS